MYEKGRGISQDYFLATEWQLKAANQGDAEAQFNIAVLYESCRGVPQNFPDAIEWCQKAAEQGHPLAKLRLVKLGRKEKQQA